jgi:hypothetical protein
MSCAVVAAPPAVGRSFAAAASGLAKRRYSASVMGARGAMPTG